MSVEKHQVQVELDLDADRVAAIDAYPSRNPGSDRSAVIGEALVLWLEHQQERDMDRQLRADSMGNGAQPADWRRVQSAALRRRK